jgi:hypothetical protein
MTEGFTEEKIRMRLGKIIVYTGKNKLNLAARELAYEFGVDPNKYNPHMTKNEIVQITFKNQSSPSQLEKDLNEENLVSLF